MTLVRKRTQEASTSQNDKFQTYHKHNARKFHLLSCSFPVVVLTAGFCCSESIKDFAMHNTLGVEEERRRKEEEKLRIITVKKQRKELKLHNELTLFYLAPHIS